MEVDSVRRDTPMEVDSVRLKHAVQFGGEVVQTLIRGKNQAVFETSDCGVTIEYVMTNPNNNTKTRHEMFVPWANILFTQGKGQSHGRDTTIQTEGAETKPHSPRSNISR